MSASLLRALGLLVPALWLAVGCGDGTEKLEVGGSCLLNTDCNSPLVCSMGKCHEGCRESRDCPVGQRCTKVGTAGVCQLPAESMCNTTSACEANLVCASDLQCRAQCGDQAGCLSGQICVQGVCADTSELDRDGKLPQSAALPLDAGQADGGPDVSPDIVGRIASDSGEAGTEAGPDAGGVDRAGDRDDGGTADLAGAEWATETAGSDGNDAGDTAGAAVPEVGPPDAGPAPDAIERDAATTETPAMADTPRESRPDTAPDIAKGAIWYVNQAASAGGDGKSWATAFSTLQSSLLNAQLKAGDQIWVAEGTYTPAASGGSRSSPFYLATGVAVYGGFHGDEATLTDRDETVDRGITILSGDLSGDDGVDTSGSPTNREDNTYHVLVGASGAMLDGFTITGGNANGTTSEQQTGGGFYGLQCDGMTLSNLLIAGNQATVFGGGMYNALGADSTMRLRNVILARNTAGSSGGGMYIGSGKVAMTGVVFESNTAADGGGLETSTSSPAIVNSVFLGNGGSSAGFGGGMSTNGSPTLTNVVFANNTGGYGGGIGRNWSGSGKLTLTNITFVGNSGGGVCFAAGTYVNMLMRNDSQPGAALGAYGETTVSHSNIEGCGTSGTGWNAGCGTDLGGNIDTTSNQFESYRAPFGSWTSAPVYAAQTSRTTFTNTAAAWVPGELVGMAIQPDTSSPVQALIAANTATTIMVWGNVTHTAASGSMYQIRSWRLAAGSQSIDAGDNTALPPDVLDLDGDGDTSEPVPFDREGNPRIVNDTVDMGAYEHP